MLIDQYMSQVNALVGKDTFKITEENQSVINNTLDIVISMFQSSTIEEIEAIPINVVENFARNLHKILNYSLTYSIDQQVVKRCIKFLASALTGHENNIRATILRAAKYPVLISILVAKCSSEIDQGHLDLFIVIKEVLKAEKRIDEHHVKLLVAAFRDFDAMANSDDKKIVKMFAEILINLCIKQPSTKTHILRRLKTTKIIEDLKNSDDNLIAFKYYIILENDSMVTDVIYFLKMSLKEILTSLKCTKDIDAVTDSLDIIERMVSSQQWSNVNLVDSEGASSLLEKLTAELVSNMHYMKTYSTVFFGKVLQYFTWLLDGCLMSPETSALFDSFVAEMCEMNYSVTSQFLNFLSAFIAARNDLNGTKDHIAAMIQKLLKQLDDPTKSLSLHVKNSFLMVLRNLHTKTKGSNNLDLNKISDFISSTIGKFKDATLSRLAEEDFDHFLYVVHTLQAYQSSFKDLADKTFNCPKLSIFIARGMMSEKPDIVEISSKLLTHEKVCTRRIAEMLANASMRPSIEMQTLGSLVLPKPDNSFHFSSFVRNKLEKDTEEILARVGECLDNNQPANIKVSDIIELNRLRFENLQDSYDIAESRIEELINEVSSLHKQIKKLSEISKAHDTNHWQANVEIETLTEQKGELLDKVKNLQHSFQLATEKFMQECEKNKQIDVLKAAHATEIKNLQQIHDKQMKAKQDEIQKMDLVLQEAESMKKTIMQLMAAKSFKN